MAIDKRIGFMGAGQMAEALARGLINKGVVTPRQITATDPVPARKELFKGLGANPVDTNLEVTGGHRLPRGGRGAGAV
jgi:pyrroline-5-carboxylate reductase